LGLEFIREENTDDAVAQQNLASGGLPLSEQE